ncbi:hypothetical protein LJC57_04255 [Parabacteroides sp. OttesenSCG-928-G07]|nr:hypothetical protein [Parabacteroides sp. OttesenSCG-928-G21]MDL2277785.1 hypothetical protein [Parabacteroides sp. OttesenSCG-928-G07]
MKKLFFIIALLTIALQFTPNKETDKQNITRSTESESVMKEENTATDVQHHLEVITNDIKNSNCLVPRRNVQTYQFIPRINVFKNTVRIFQDIRLKGAEKLQKVSEYLSGQQTINYSILRSVKGYHVYALRKIII